MRPISKRHFKRLVKCCAKVFCGNSYGFIFLPSGCRDYCKSGENIVVIGYNAKLVARVLLRLDLFVRWGK